jgi:hypothetical protein
LQTVSSAGQIARKLPFAVPAGLILRRMCQATLIHLARDLLA